MRCASVSWYESGISGRGARFGSAEIEKEGVLLLYRPQRLNKARHHLILLGLLEADTLAHHHHLSLLLPVRPRGRESERCVSVIIENGRETHPETGATCETSETGNVTARGICS